MRKPTLLPILVLSLIVSAVNGQTIQPRPQMDGSAQAQAYFERAYRCGAIIRVHPASSASDLDERMKKQLADAGCSGMDLSSESLLTDLLSQARAGNPKAIARLASGAPLSDPDPQVERKLEQRFAAELPIVLSSAVAAGNVEAMRFYAEYFSACRIQLNGVSIYSGSPGYVYKPQESLRLLQRARELAGPAENSQYTEFETLLLAGQAGSLGDICPTRRGVGFRKLF